MEAAEALIAPSASAHRAAAADRAPPAPHLNQFPLGGEAREGVGGLSAPLRGALWGEGERGRHSPRANKGAALRARYRVPDRVGGLGDGSGEAGGASPGYQHLVPPRPLSGTCWAALIASIWHQDGQILTRPALRGSHRLIDVLKTGRNGP